MQNVSYDTPLVHAIKQCSLPELVRLLRGAHPAFLAAIVRAHTRQSVVR